MAHWHTSTDGSRWRLEEDGERDILVVSFGSKSAAAAGIAQRVGRGMVLVDQESVGRIVCRFRFPVVSADDLIGVAQDLAMRTAELSKQV